MASLFEVKAVETVSKKINWMTPTSFHDEHGENPQKLASMSEKYETMRNGYIGRIPVAKHWNEVFDENGQSTHASPYRG